MVQVNDFDRRSGQYTKVLQSHATKITIPFFRYFSEMETHDSTDKIFFYLNFCSDAQFLQGLVAKCSIKSAVYFKYKTVYIVSINTKQLKQNNCLPKLNL